MSTNSKIRVLLIDDSRVVRVTATKIFGPDFDVSLAVDGEDGLSILESDANIQVVFTDLVMPQMDGFELLKVLRSHQNTRFHQLPIIVMTGADNPETAKAKALALGATDFITKPFDATDIRARARSYSALLKATASLKRQITVDELTGLVNRRGLYRQLEKDISFIQANFIEMGRANAEKTIKHLGKRLASAFRREDVIARTGVARFTASMPLVEKTNALEMANRLCRIIEGLKATLNGKPLNLTVSVGVFHFDPSLCDVITAEDFCDVADEALDKAKTLGQSQIYLLAMDEFLQQKQDALFEALSIDELLQRLQLDETVEVVAQLDLALQKLAPLLSLLSNEQKQVILQMRA